MLCEYCGQYCFVPIPKDAPSDLTLRIRNQMKDHLTSGMLATCASGQRADKVSAWHTNYSEIMAVVLEQEHCAVIDRLLDRQERMKDFIDHMISRGALQGWCSNCTDGIQLLAELKNG